ncbi:predicted protein [Sclerotinia sclerotiorum 1980 UF-70]|uniref:Uncharacterized protein n=1 Tax=Sclerotinia sclerotiorum (strain ATCC 18683 / 1980 / Ss-1) TaxID=665079 RepID=A7EHX0_SCLS1|nr:predicted protein [Sclerotinia sclerotiorum 1980 UF-70]EDO02436.1 predicted protein [Sclerotinia sclerotiorum 1980 UF-70]
MSTHDTITRDYLLEALFDITLIEEIFHAKTNWGDSPDFRTTIICPPGSPIQLLTDICSVKCFNGFHVREISGHSNINMRTIQILEGFQLPSDLLQEKFRYNFSSKGKYRIHMFNFSQARKSKGNHNGFKLSEFFGFNHKALSSILTAAKNWNLLKYSHEDVLLIWYSIGIIHRNTNSIMSSYKIYLLEAAICIFALIIFADGWDYAKKYQVPKAEARMRAIILCDLLQTPPSKRFERILDLLT